MTMEQDAMHLGQIPVHLGARLWPKKLKLPRSSADNHGLVQECSRAHLQEANGFLLQNGVQSTQKKTLMT